MLSLRVDRLMYRIIDHYHVTTAGSVGVVRKGELSPKHGGRRVAAESDMAV